MEPSPCAQEVSHTASLLTSLNLQRERAQFCDCVVRQRQSPGQLYPAHRCVLAASSPVLASFLSSTGALVELQAPCLSGSVLALLLDYIYTGILPYNRTQKYYYSLLTAACYLQMDELQGALKAWQKTHGNDTDKKHASSGPETQPYEEIIHTNSKTTNSCTKCLPLTCDIEGFGRREETDTCSVKSPECSLEDHQCSANMKTCDEDQMHSANIDSCIKGGKTDICDSSSINGADCCRRKAMSTLSNVSKCCSVPEHCIERSVITANCRHVTHLTTHDLIQNIPHTAEIHGVAKVNKEVQKDHFQSIGPVKPETWQKSTEEEPVMTAEDRRNSCTSSSSPPHLCCGAVPVIRHSSRAARLQLAEVSTMAPQHAVSQASVNSSSAPVSGSARTDKDSPVEGVTAKHKNHYGVQSQDYRNHRVHTETQSWDNQNNSDQCVVQDLFYKSSKDQSDVLEQDYKSKNAAYFTKQIDEFMEKRLSHVTQHNDHENHTKHLTDESLPQHKIYSSFIRGLKCKTELTFDDLPSKHQRLDSHDVSVSAAEEELSQHLTAVVSLPVEDSDREGDSHCQDLFPEREAKEEHNYSNKCPAEMDRRDPHFNLCGPKTNRYSKLHRAETSTLDTASIQIEHDSDNRGTSMEVKRHSADVYLPIDTTPESSLDNVARGLFVFERHKLEELEKISDTEITEQHLTFTMSVNSNMSDPMHSVDGKSYCGRLHCHCLPQEDTHLLRGDSDHKHFRPSHPDYSDQSRDKKETGTFASPSHSSLRQQFATVTTDQVLLLDISTKPSELLVSYRSEEGEKGVTFSKNDTFGTGVMINDREQRKNPTSVKGFKKRKIIARTKFGGDVKERESGVKDQRTLGADVTHKMRVVEEISNHKEGEKQSSTLTVGSLPSVPDSVQASMSSALSVHIPSTISASMPTNISAHLSTPHHPFQCSLCDRSFSQRGSLNRHVRSHLGVRPFPCPCCPMTFSRQYRVTEHMRVHRRCTLENNFHKQPASST